jgi:Holliday junction DNA helicase RuvA
MIAYLEGQLVEENPTHIVIENNGVGYFVHIPLSSYKKFPTSALGVRVFTHLHVREDALQLYGFASEEERELFRMLIAISGVGPRLAQSVLSGISVAQFKQCMAEGNLLPLTSIPGIGKKTAQRLLVELREKFKVEGVQTEAGGEVPGEVFSPLDRDAIKALVSLGCRIQEAERLVRLVRSSEAGDLSLEDLILRALQRS